MGKSSPEDLLLELITRAKEGDNRAYGRLFRLCYKDIYDYVLRRVGSVHDAEDLTMNVFTKGYTGVTSFEDRGCSVRAWFYRIAHNAVVDHFRVSRESVDIDEIPGFVSGEAEIEDVLFSKAEREKLYREVLKLPPAQAEVLILRFMKDLSVSETAEALDKKEVTVRALQFKGIKNLRERLTGTQGEDESNGRL
ncbi:MAG: sigma-70 family RNA polymerase sigma factor [Actinobacteria bacterium]|nr:sigma-70 family RNA polymerase sigma factor [Actinomycetota bacterium]